MRVASSSLAGRLAASFVLSTLVLAPAAAAAPARPSASAVTPAGAQSLAPGRFAWHEEAQGSGPLRVVVSLPLQLAFVLRGETLVGASSVSTGAPGYDTPVGTFTILEKDKDHRSNLYDDAPMPYMLRMTWDGVALHAGKVTGQPASHGCVRLPAAFARRLFEIADLGATVEVVDDIPAFLDAPAQDIAGTTDSIETAER